MSYNEERCCDNEMFDEDLFEKKKKNISKTLSVVVILLEFVQFLFVRFLTFHYYINDFVRRQMIFRTPVIEHYITFIDWLLTRIELLSIP